MSWWRTSSAMVDIGFKRSIFYRFSMMVSVFVGPFMLVLQYLIWKAVFTASGTDTLAGYSFESIMLYYTMGLLILYFTWDDANIELSESIREGTFMTFLTRPLAFNRFAFMNKIGNRALAFLIEVVPVAIIIGIIFGFRIYAAGNWLYYALGLLVAFIVFFEINIILGCLAFYFIRVHGFNRLWQMASNVLGGWLIPLSFLPDFMQNVLFWLPVQFLYYAPVRMFFGTYELGGYSLSQPMLLLYGVAHIIALALIAFVFWKISIKRFQGVGT